MAAVAERPTAAVDALSPDETANLLRLERMIERDLEATGPIFLRLGRNLREIRDLTLYRGDYPSFDAYLRHRWAKTRGYAYRVLAAATVVDNLADTPDGEPPAVLPMNESQCRPLVSLEPERQRSAWGEAVRDAGGEVPTAKVVKAAADRVTAELGPADPDEPKGLTALRRAGVVAPTARATIEDAPHDAAEGDDDGPSSTSEEPEECELSDAVWLERFEIRTRLGRLALARFDQAALNYRHATPARKKFHSDVRPIFERSKREHSGHIDPYMLAIYRALRLEDPSRWVACRECKDADGKSTGQITLIGDCAKCGGEGYHVR
jgi:hypothetical protein